MAEEGKWGTNSTVIQRSSKAEQRKSAASATSANKPPPPPATDSASLQCCQGFFCCASKFNEAFVIATLALSVVLFAVLIKHIIGYVCSSSQPESPPRRRRDC